MRSIAWLLLALGCTANAATPEPLDRIERVAGVGDGPIVVLLHGFASMPEHFLGMTQRTDLPPGTHFVLPRAPLRVDGVDRGTAWFPLPSDLGTLRRRRVPEMDDARARVIEMLDRLRARFGARPLVLGGFSQGAMVSLDVALHDARPICGLALMSGTLVDEAATDALLDRRRGQRVYVSHGTSDPVLHYDDDARLVEMMRAHDLDVEFRTFDGAHVVTDDVAADVAAVIRRCAD
jgi:phospholipase/carboxylesterase